MIRQIIILNVITRKVLVQFLLEKYLNLVKAELSNTVFVLFIQNASDQDIFYCKITSYRTTIFDISNYATFTRNMTDAIKLRIHFVIHTLL